MNGNRRHDDENPQEQLLLGELRFGPYVLIPARRLLTKDGQVVRVGSRALDLLILLTEHAGEVVSNEELIRQIWGKNVVVENNLRVHVASVRKVLEEGAEGTRFIDNIPMRGYCFVAPVTVSSCTPGDVSQLPIISGSRLPSIYGPLFGRQCAVDDLKRLSSAHRLVSVVGTGGIGKTSVAVAVAQELKPAFENGVVFVDLSALSAGSDIAHLLACALGAAADEADPSSAPDMLLRGRHLLLVLVMVQFLRTPR